MSASHFKKAPLDRDGSTKTQISAANLSEGRLSSFKLCSHAAVTRRSRRQFTCATKDLDDQSSSIWRFLSWVAYSRTCAARSQITDDERLRCPLLWCRCVLGDQNMLLEHVFTCAHLSDGRYWCFSCQKEESFAPFQCRHCHVPVFGESLSVKVKRLWRSLGTKSNHKDHQALDSSSLPTGTSCAFRNQYFEYLPENSSATRATEMDNNQLFRELGEDCIPAVAELNGSSAVPAELWGDFSPMPKQDDSSFGSKNPTRSEEPAPVPYEASLDAIQVRAFPNLSFDLQEPPNQPPLKNNETSTLGYRLPQLQSLLHRQSEQCMTASYADAISDSPTETDFSGASFFTKSFQSDISPLSSRNSTMQSFPHSSLGMEKPVGHPPVSSMDDINGEMRRATPDTAFYSAELEAIPSVKRSIFTRSGSPQLLTPKHLLNNFWKCLTLNVAESSKRLKMLPESPVINQLLSVTADKIAFTGFSAFQATVNGYPPTTILDMYALVHTAHACAIVIYDGEVEDKLKLLFAHSLSINDSALSDEDKKIYRTIVYSIWCPEVGDGPLHNFNCLEPYHRHFQPQIVQSRFKGKAPFYQADLTESHHLEEFLGMIEAEPYGANGVINMPAHFLDIFEGITLCRQVNRADMKLTYGCGDENFIRIIKENVTTPLMNGQFQPTPSLEAFIDAVSEIERLVIIGLINTVREVEVGLICAGRSTTHSIKLYELFFKRVKELCYDLYFELPQIRSLQIENESPHGGIHTMLKNLEMVILECRHPDLDKEHWYHSDTGLDNILSRAEEEAASLENNMDISTIEEHSQGNPIQTELSRCSAIKRKRTLSSSSTSSSETGPSPSTTASPNTLSESLEGQYSRCSLCGFQPTGQRKWHKRTMRRHRLTHVDPSRKEAFLCIYEGCKSSYTRADNLSQHVQRKHSQNKRQRGPSVNIVTESVKTSPKCNGSGGS